MPLVPSSLLASHELGELAAMLDEEPDDDDLDDDDDDDPERPRLVDHPPSRRRRFLSVIRAFPSEPVTYTTASAHCYTETGRGVAGSKK